MRDRKTSLAWGLAAAQLLDALGNELVPRRFIDAHLDHLNVPERLRPLLPTIKVASSLGLTVGIAHPRLGVLTSSCLVAYYAAAVAFHLRADESAILALPAAAFGLAAARALTEVYLPAARRS